MLHLTDTVHREDVTAIGELPWDVKVLKSSFDMIDQARSYVEFLKDNQDRYFLLIERPELLDDEKSLANKTYTYYIEDKNVINKLLLAE